MRSAEQQAKKDTQDLRYLCAHFDAILDGMRQAYERLETKCEALIGHQDVLAAHQNKHVRVMEQFVQAMAARLEALEARVDALEADERW